MKPKDDDLVNQAEAAQRTNDWPRAVALWRQASEATEDAGQRQRFAKQAAWCDDMAALVNEPGAQPILRPGDRVRLVAMQDDPDPVDAGQIGTVVAVRRYDYANGIWHQIDVAWDNGRTLMLVSPPDRFEIVSDEADGA